MSPPFLEAAVHAAREAGALLIERLGTLQPGQIGLKGRSDYVTEVDRESERLIISRLRAAFPTHEIIGEEATAPSIQDGQRIVGGPFALRRAQDERAQGPGATRNSDLAKSRWYIDPLDGTTNYIHGFPMFCVSIALEQAGQRILGVVYDPLRQELFTAERGRGAFLNQQRIHVTAPPSLEQGLIATGFPFRSLDRVEQYLRSFREVLLQAEQVRRAGSAALDLAYVACGRLDGFWEMGLAPWDIAAGALLVREAGGIVTDFQGTFTCMTTGNVVAASAAIHPALIAILRPIFSPPGTEGAAGGS